ncbi:MAG TPA: hypothetical protein VG815_07840 [Chloroflexota bacterium]|nr:hypothetical protein [Chloroflexota bacterium]
MILKSAPLRALAAAAAATTVVLAATAPQVTAGSPMAMMHAAGPSAHVQRDASASVLWSATVPAMPPGALPTGNSSLNSVACETRAYCVAVGSFTNGHGHTEAMIDTERDGRWTSMAAPLPADGTPDYDSLSKVVCVATTCTAIGQYSSSTYGYVGLILSLTAHGWVANTAIPPTDYYHGLPDRLDNVACSPNGQCAIVGIYEQKTGLGTYQNVGIFLTGSGSSWNMSVAPIPGDAQVSQADYYLSETEAISCPVNGTCYALGLYSKGNDPGGALAYTGWGGSWSYQDLGTVGNVYNLSCTAAKFCAGSGRYYPSVGLPQSDVIEGVGGSFTAKPVVVPPGAKSNSGYIDSTACAVSGVCVVTGQYAAGSKTEAFIDSSAGGAWKSSAVALPASGSNAAPAAAACFSPASCAITGNYTASTSNQQGMMITGSATGWKASAAALPPKTAANPAVQMQSVACPVATSCTAAGSVAIKGSSGSVSRGLVETSCSLAPPSANTARSADSAGCVEVVVQPTRADVLSTGLSWKTSPPPVGFTSNDHDGDFIDTCRSGCRNVIVFVREPGTNSGVGGVKVTVGVSRLTTDVINPSQGGGYVCEVAFLLNNRDGACGNPITVTTDTFGGDEGKVYLRYYPPAVYVPDGDRPPVATVTASTESCGATCSQVEGKAGIEVGSHLLYQKLGVGLTWDEKQALIEWDRNGSLIKNVKPIDKTLSTLSKLFEKNKTLKTLSKALGDLAKVTKLYGAWADYGILEWFQQRFGIADDGLVHLGSVNTLADQILKYVKDPVIGAAAGWIKSKLLQTHTYTDELVKMLLYYANRWLWTDETNRFTQIMNVKLFEASYCRNSTCRSMAPGFGVNFNLYVAFSSADFTQKTPFFQPFNVNTAYAAPTWIPAQCKLITDPKAQTDQCLGEP